MKFSSEKKDYYNNLIENCDYDLMSEFRKIRKANNFMYGANQCYDRDFMQFTNDFDSMLPSGLLAYGIQQLNNYYNRLNRLKKFISNMIDKDCLFLTLTFDNETLENTTAQTRRVYVRRFLSKFNTYAVANKDFGSKNGREHYHAIIQLDNVRWFDWHYGALNFKRIINSNESAISKYIMKLSYHAVKSTTSGNLIYLRKK